MDVTQPARADAFHVPGQVPRANPTIDFYDRNAARYAETTRSLNLSHEIALLLERLPPGARVLDVGCGGGRDLLVFRRAGIAATGVELSTQLAEIAREYSGCPVIVADLRHPPFEEGTFDGIWAAASLLHLSRDEVPAALNRLRQLLRSGGRFFASVKAGVGAEQDDAGRQFTYFDPDEWRDFLIRAGFSNVEVKLQRPSPRGTPWIQSFATAM